MEGGRKGDVALQVRQQRPDQRDALDRQDLADVEEADLGIAGRDLRHAAGKRINQGCLRLDGIGAPKSTPADVIERLNRETNAVLADPKMKARLAELGASVLSGSPADFGKLIVDETAKWAKVVKLSGVKPD